MSAVGIEARARRRLSPEAEGVGKSDGKPAQNPSPSQFLTCVNAFGVDGSLTEGRDYTVTHRDGRCVTVIDDEGLPTRFYIYRFRHPLTAPPILGPGKRPWPIARGSHSPFTKEDTSMPKSDDAAEPHPALVITDRRIRFTPTWFGTLNKGLSPDPDASWMARARASDDAPQDPAEPPRFDFGDRRRPKPPFVDEDTANETVFWCLLIAGTLATTLGLGFVFGAGWTLARLAIAWLTGQPLDVS